MWTRFCQINTLVSQLMNESDVLGSAIKYAYLPSAMIKPVSFLEELSNFLVFVDLLYPKEYG